MTITKQTEYTFNYTFDEEYLIKTQVVKFLNKKYPSGKLLTGFDINLSKIGSSTNVDNKIYTCFFIGPTCYNCDLEFKQLGLTLINGKIVLTKDLKKRIERSKKDTI